MPKVIIADNVRLPLAELFGGRLKQRRLAHNMTQAQLAERTGSTAAYISQVERAQANPTLDLMAKIAEVLDTDVRDLLRPNND